MKPSYFWGEHSQVEGLLARTLFFMIIVQGQQTLFTAEKKGTVRTMNFG